LRAAVFFRARLRLELFVASFAFCVEFVEHLVPDYVRYPFVWLPARSRSPLPVSKYVVVSLVVRGVVALFCLRCRVTFYHRLLFHGSSFRCSRCSDLPLIPFVHFAVAVYLDALLPFAWWFDDVRLPFVALCCIFLLLFLVHVALPFTFVLVVTSMSAVCCAGGAFPVATFALVMFVERCLTFVALTFVRWSLPLPCCGTVVRFVRSFVGRCGFVCSLPLLRSRSVALFVGYHSI